MKNYNKKLVIMFVMLLAIIGFGTIQNGTIVNAATVGQQLTELEDGWTRYDERNENIIYSSGFVDFTNTITYENSLHYIFNSNGSIKFNFIGSKIRIIGETFNSYSPNVKIKIDGTLIGNYNEYISSNYINKVLLYDKLNLNLQEHFVELYTDDNKGLSLDAIDIDKSGNLKPYNEIAISLDKS